MTATYEALARLRESADYCRHRDIDTIQVKKADLLPVVALIDEMAEALRPFGAVYEYDDIPRHFPEAIYLLSGVRLILISDDLRRAAAILAKLTPITEEKA